MKIQVDKDWLKRQINSNPEDESCEAGVIDLAKVFEMADRREAYCKSHKPCPECKAKQVQLVASQESHGDWKCRRCSHKWQTTL